MATFTLTQCPFCFKENANGTVVSYYFPLKKHALGGMEFSLFGHCNFCRATVMATSGYDGSFESEQRIKNHQEHLYTCDAIDHYRTRWFPTPPAHDIPQYLPFKVAKKFLQGELLYAQPHMQDPAANAYMLALERAINHLQPNLSNESILEKLEILYDAGIITQSLLDFANHIEGLQYTVAPPHEDISHEALERLKIFTRLFLLYAFTLPTMIPKAISSENVLV